MDLSGQDLSTTFHMQQLATRPAATGTPSVLGYLSIHRFHLCIYHQYPALIPSHSSISTVALKVALACDLVVSQVISLETPKVRSLGSFARASTQPSHQTSCHLATGRV